MDRALTVDGDPQIARILQFGYPPETAFDVVFLAVLTLALLVFIMLAATLLYRVRIFVQDRLRAARVRRYVAMAERLAAGDLELPSFLSRVPSWDHRLVEGLLLDLAPRFTGETRESLQHAFVGLGSVSRAVRQTRSPLWHRRAAAAARLGAMGLKERRTTLALRRLLDDREPEVRIAAARALVELKAYDTLPDIVATLNRVETFSVLRMSEIIMAAGQAAVPALMDFLRRPGPPRAHSVALEQLGALRAVQAEELIRDCLASESLEVRAAACRTLGRIRSSDGVTPLIAACTDSAWQVRGQAARALGELGDPVAVVHLLPLLQEPHWWTVYNTARSLAHLGATAELQKALAAAPDPNGTLPSILREVLSPVGREA